MKIAPISSSYSYGKLSSSVFKNTQKNNSINFGSGVYINSCRNPEDNTYVYIGNMDLVGLHQYNKTSDPLCHNTIIEELQYGCFSVPYGDPRGLTHIGYAYIDKDGKYTPIKGEIPDRIVKNLLTDKRALDMSINSGGIGPDRVHKYLLDRGRIAEAINLAKHSSVTKVNSNRHVNTFDHSRESDAASTCLTVLPKELIKRGRLTEAKQLVNKSWYNGFNSPVAQKEFLSEYGINEKGEYNYNLSMPDEFDNAPYNKQIDELSDKMKSMSSLADILAEQEVSHYEGKNERTLKDIFSLGTYELLRAYRVYKEKKSYLHRVNYNINCEKNSVIEKEQEAKKEHTDIVESIKKAQAHNSRLNELKQPVKSILERTIIARLLMSKNGENVSVPNSIMFVGENPYMSQEFAKWTADSTKSDFTIVRSDLYNSTMIRNLSKQLSKAEENWK